MTGFNPREIKFRAWDKKKKKIVTDFVLAPTSPSWGAFPIEKAAWLEEYQKIIHDKIGCIDDEWKLKLSSFTTSDYTLTDWANYYGLEEYTIMQFTGIHDKNGKGIYEGDIVKRIAKRSCCGAVEYTIEGVVEWFCEGWVVRENGDDIGGCAWANQKNEIIEVIGNIFENPELLAQAEGKE
jgi:uncharacterized phage protein (TIGR01671 family)